VCRHLEIAGRSQTSCLINEGKDLFTVEGSGEEGRAAPGECGGSSGPGSGPGAGPTGGTPDLSASSRRSAAPSLRSKDDTWLSTVRTEMCSFWAICALVRWSLNALSTSASRSEIVVGSTSTTVSILPRFASGLHRVRGESVVNPW
jgi:hypothetical protein